MRTYIRTSVTLNTVFGLPFGNINCDASLLVSGRAVRSSTVNVIRSFIRFKTLELGYSFPFVRIYFSGDNLAVWSPFKYWDPELFYYSYPLHRTFSLGLQFTF